jgi:signal transduction histidine kinase
MERALLTLLAEHTSLAAAASNADGTLAMMTPALERMLGHAYRPWAESDLPEVLHLYCEDGSTPLSVEEMPIAKARAGETVIDQVVTVRPDEDGDRLVYLRCNATPLTDEDGVIRGAFVLAQDVTGEHLAHAREAELRDRLLTTVNHELRTPVTKVVGHAELLEDRREELPVWARRSVEVISEAAAELADLSSTITQLADLEAAPHVDRIPVDAAEGIRSVVESLSRRRGEQGVVLRLEAPEHAQATIDLAAVRRAVRALVDNAATFSPTGSPITVCLKLDEACLVVTVSDHGPGIRPEERERVLEPFERGGSSGDGSSSRGLGLALARTVANAHGGDLLLRDNEPSGLVAELRLCC